jgi:hypothetical protein
MPTFYRKVVPYRYRFKDCHSEDARTSSYAVFATIHEELSMGEEW